MLAYKWGVMALLGLGVVAHAEIRMDPDAYRSLVSDRRAYDVGDILTVIVVESTSAASTAGTGATAKTEIAGAAGNQNNQYGVNLALTGDTNGAGQTSRTGQVKTKVAVRVTEKVDGLLRISGSQVLTVNDEKQNLTVSGLVRPDDIAGDNTVFSNRIAEAHIEIAGDGVVAQAQKQNVIYRFLKWLRLI